MRLVCVHKNTAALFENRNLICEITKRNIKRYHFKQKAHLFVLRRFNGNF